METQTVTIEGLTALLGQKAWLADGYSLSSVADLQHEINQARFLEDLAPGIRLFWFPCDRRYQHVSSTAIRSLAKFDPAQASSYLPDHYPCATQP